MSLLLFETERAGLYAPTLDALTDPTRWAPRWLWKERRNQAFRRELDEGTRQATAGILERTKAVVLRALAADAHAIDWLGTSALRDRAFAREMSPALIDAIWWQVAVPMALNNPDYGPKIGIWPTLFATVATPNFTKRGGSYAARVYLTGGGGSGGSGRRGATATARGGGSGGGTANICWRIFLSDAFGTTEVVTVGAGGTGAPAGSVDSTDGTDGGNAAASQFGSVIAMTAGRGRAGRGALGTAGGVSVGNDTPTNCSANERAGGFNSGTGGLGAGGTDGSGGNISTDYQVAAAGGAGGGGGISAANATEKGGNGSQPGSVTGPFSATLPTAGVGAVNVAGTNGGDATSMSMTGASGGGGSSGTVKTGGNGGAPGGGAGGGGASLNGTASGAGGNGGRGQCLVIEELR